MPGQLSVKAGGSGRAAVTPLHYSMAEAAVMAHRLACLPISPVVKIPFTAEMFKCCVLLYQQPKMGIRNFLADGVILITAHIKC